MGKGSSQLVRDVAIRDYLSKKDSRDGAVVIEVGELQEKLFHEGFPPSHVRQICEALKSKKLQQAQGVSVRVLGDDYRVTTRYEFRPANKPEMQTRGVTPAKDSLLGLRGSLRGAIREGAKAFLEEIRRDSKESQ